MAVIHRLSRRVFLSQLGRGTLAIAILGTGIVACSTDAGTGDTGSTEGSPTTGATSPPTTAGTTSTTAGDTTTTGDTTPGPAAVTWERVNLGFVSAYVLIRNAEAALVDTGVSGSAGDIEQVLTAVELGWDAVGHVVITHLHPDHQGSLPEVLNRATEADGYAGEADISGISSPRPLTAVGDGDDVFGLQIIDTPGHTAGHIAVLDPVGGLLVAGDAMNGQGGGVVGANPQFTDDMAQADESVRKLATFEFDTLVFGHGEPVIGGAGDAVKALAASL